MVCSLRGVAFIRLLVLGLDEGGKRESGGGEGGKKGNVYI